jgi:hypothetical protein
LKLSFILRDGFLISRFRTSGGPTRTEAFELLSKPCEIKFGYIEQEQVEADVKLISPRRDDVFDADECIVMYFVNGIWQIVG